MRRKVFVVYIVLGMLFAPSLVFGKSDRLTVEPNTLPDEDVIVLDAYIEETRLTVSDRVLRLADTIDTLFGDKRVDDQNNLSTLRVSQRYFTKSGVTGADDISVNVNLHLPNLREIEERIKKKFTPRSSDSGSEGGGLVENIEPNPWTFNQESGLVIASPINYFARLRARRDFLSKKMVHSFYEQLGWSKLNEWEEETSLNSDYAINRSLLFRFVNVKKWEMTNNKISSSHGPSLLQQVWDKAAISYDLRFNTLVEDNALYAEKVSLSSMYRTQLDIGWIFMDINPEIAWERETNFRVQYNFFIRFELVFGRLHPEE